MKKTPTQIKEQYAKLQWYKQAGAVRPWYVGYPTKACAGCTVQGRKRFLSYEPFGMYFKNDFFDVYFPRHRMKEVSAYYVQREKRYPGFFQKLFQLL